MSERTWHPSAAPVSPVASWPPARASAAVAPGRISGKHHVAPAAASAAGSGCVPPTSATSIVPAVRSPACSALVMCSGVQASAPTSARPSRPWRRTRRGPAPSPVRPAIQIGTRGCCTPAGVVDAPAGAGDGHAGQHLVEQHDPGVERGGPGAVVGRRLVEQRVLAVAVDPEAEPEHHPAARQAIERRGRLGDELRAAARQRGDHRADQHSLGRDRDRGQRDERVGEGHQRAVPEMVPDEHGVPPGRFGGERHVGEQPWVGQVTGQRDRQAPPHRDDRTRHSSCV